LAVRPGDLSSLACRRNSYNFGAINILVFFEELVGFAKNLTEGEQRTVSEGLSEEELAVFDILTKPQVSLTESA
jgi:type I restriction enzyme R subunit